MVYPNQYFLLVFHLFILQLFCAGSNGSATTCLAEQSSLLLQLKREFSFDENPFLVDESHPKMKHWKPEKDCCGWDGVTCEADSGEITSLDLTGSWLKGPLLSNSTFFRLISLKRLSLAYNAFDDSIIPLGFARLSRLTHLNLSHTPFHGEIPYEISRLTSLVSLDLSGSNGLYVPPAPLFHNMTRLTTLNLDEVGLSSVKLVKVFENVSDSLKSLSLRNSDPNCSVPERIFQFPNIEAVDLSGNLYLTGFLPEFPPESSLKSLDLSYTGLSGIIPDSIGNLEFLHTLTLSNSRFSGAIPSSLGNLSRLKSIDLSQNNFSGPVPFTLENLHRLVKLDLSLNKFDGQIPPEIFNLPLLRYFYLSENNLSGSLPLTLGNLSQLVHLDFSENSFSGELPPTIGRLKKCDYLDFSHCKFSGELPSSLGNLSQLKILDIRWNSFTGRIPSSLRNFVKIEELLISNNKFHGELPIIMTNLTQLSSIDLSYNDLTGHINPFNPSSLLSRIDYSHNLFTGVIPSSLLSSVSYLNLSHNQFSRLQTTQNVSSSFIQTMDLSFNRLQGPIVVPSFSLNNFFISQNNLTGNLPLTLCNLTMLRVLDASNNNINGTIPLCLTDHKMYLVVLNLQGNNLGGDISGMLFSGRSLRVLEFDHNKLTGKIPRSLIKCKNVEVLNLGYNRIRDIFPFWMESLPNLKVLILRSNKLHGKISNLQKGLGFTELRILDLSFNSFEGTLPPRFFKILMLDVPVQEKPKLEYIGDNFEYYQVSVTVANKGSDMEIVKIINIFTSIDLSNNNFLGEIPRTIGDLRSLIVLNLSSNNFQGLIPSSLGNLTELESLDLSGNELSGEIPPELKRLTFLQYLNVSENRLQGRIPQGQQFNTFTSSSFGGNFDLCGSPLTKKCGGLLDNIDQSRANDSGSDSDSDFGWKPVLIGYGCGFLAAAVAGHFMLSKNRNWVAKTFGRKI